METAEIDAMRETLVAVADDKAVARMARAMVARRVWVRMFRRFPFV